MLIQESERIKVKDRHDSFDRIKFFQSLHVYDSPTQAMT